MDRHAAHVPGPTDPAAPNDTPTREDVGPPRRRVTLPQLRTSSGAPVVVEIRMLYAHELVMVRGRVPGPEPRPAGAMAEDAAAAIAKKRTPQARAAALLRHREECAECILEAAVEPMFYRGKARPEQRHQAEDGHDIAWVSLDALADADATLLWAEIMALAAGTIPVDGKRTNEGGAEAERLGDFSGERGAEGVGGGARDADVVRADDDAARAVGVPGEAGPGAGADTDPGAGPGRGDDPRSVEASARGGAESGSE